MAWPNSRLTTYSAAAKIKSADLNAIQDAIITDQHGDHVLNLSPVGNAQIISGWVPIADNGYLRADGAGIQSFIVGLPLKQGDRVKTITFARFGNAAADITEFTLLKIAANGTTTPHGTMAVVDPAAAWADSTLDVADITIGAGECLFIQVTANAATIRIGSIRVTYDHP